MDLKHIPAIGALLFCCTALGQTSAGIRAYNSSPPISRAYFQDVRAVNVEDVKEDLRAAESGDASAQFRMALWYDSGQGVAQNYVEAYIWSSIAAVSGDEGAMNNRSLAGSHLSPEEFEAANKRATDLYEAIQQGKG